MEKMAPIETAVVLYSEYKILYTTKCICQQKATLKFKTIKIVLKI